MTTQDPFTPRGTLSASTLKAYAEGMLDHAAAHEVELHLEADPLLRDAADGYSRPQAVAGAARLQALRPKGNSTSWSTWTLSAIMVATASAVLWHSHESGKHATIDEPSRAPIRGTSQAPSALEVNIGLREIQDAQEIPESLIIGHSFAERHVRTRAKARVGSAPDTIPYVAIAPVEPRRSTVPERALHDDPSPEPHQRRSLQLVYLHDLKLIHPDHLHGRNSEVDRSLSGVDARFSNATDRDKARQAEQRIPYLDFMDEAMAKFKRNDHKGCLEDLRFVLGQYPDDVNALFYAGLCCYNLGMDQRAERFLLRASTHAFPVFDEEAEWYHALALYRLGEHDTAQQAFQRIAQGKGFYAPRAAAKLLPE